MDRRKKRLTSCSSTAPLLRSDTASAELTHTETRATTMSDSTLFSENENDEPSSYVEIEGNSDVSSESLCLPEDIGKTLRNNNDCLQDYLSEKFFSFLKKVANDNQILQKNYKSLKKMLHCITGICMLLFAIILVLVIGNIVFSKTCHNKGTQSPGLTDEQIKQRIAELSEHLGNYKTTCIECTVLGELLGNEEFWNQVSIDQNGECCVQDPAGLFEKLIEKTEELSPMVNQVIDELKVIIEALKVNATEKTVALTKGVQNLQDVNNVQMWGRNSRDKKGAVHLEGSFDTSDRQIVWTNRAASSSILLTSGSKNVIITNSGNYFIYARVKFITTNYQDSNRPLSYKIYQRTKHGNVRVLEEAQHKPNVGSTFDTLCTMHRVAQFNEGDQVYLYISGPSMLNVATGNVHEFGMFEI